MNSPKKWSRSDLQILRQTLRGGGTFFDVGILLSRLVQEIWEKAREIGFHMERKERGWECQSLDR
jgi:hypothetical protein